jgi:hypothetical protein
MSSVAAEVVRRARGVLPEGRSLPEELWYRRHRGLVRLLWLHAVGILVYGLVQDASLLHAVLEASAPAVAAAFASSRSMVRGVRSSAAALGLVASSAVLVHLSGGLIELHFHYFVVVGLLSLYQEWRPFLIAIGFVAIQHGAAGWIDPGSVYNHPAAQANPWRWALVHGGHARAVPAG